MSLQSTEIGTRELERRKDIRYRLDMPVVGYIEHNMKRHAGRVIDVSVSGFCLFIPKEDGTGRDLLWTTAIDFGEIVIQDQLVGGFGRGVHINRIASGVLVGFEWDDYVFETHWLALSSLIGDVLSQQAAGCMSGGDPRFVPGGKVVDRLQFRVA